MEEFIAMVFKEQQAKGQLAVRDQSQGGEGRGSQKRTSNTETQGQTDGRKSKVTGLGQAGLQPRTHRSLHPVRLTCLMFKAHSVLLL